MWKFSFVLVMLVACAWAQGSGGQPPVFDCTGKEGFFPDLYRSCQVYYRCTKNDDDTYSKTTYGCPFFPEQTYYDAFTYYACVTADKVYCPDPSAL